MPHDYLEIKRRGVLPRLPLEGMLDITYRCNNNCRHCWLWIPPDSPEREDELSCRQIRKIVNEARGMGCRKWVISGGEPMIRPDFAEIFDYITSNCASYSINTNGALITPKIAGLMKRKGSKMVALYGATSEIHDHITRNPGSFEATLRGLAYLKEAGAGFIIQLVLMKDNYHQFNDMTILAKSLSAHCRVGASWLYPSAYRDPDRNKHIMGQRLQPKEALKVDRPNFSAASCNNIDAGEHFFSSCVNSGCSFHIDAYGKMGFCSFIKTPLLRYDLTRGNFKEGWNGYIPSLATKVGATEEYKKNCGSCDLRKECRWCPVYGYLEHGDFSSKVGYLCAIAAEKRSFKENWEKEHRRYFKIAGITIRVDSDLPINEKTFHHKFKRFEVPGPGEGAISINHHFALPDLADKNLGEKVYRRPPWAIYKKNDSWIYTGISTTPGDNRLHRIAVFNSSHTKGVIYNDKGETFKKGQLASLTMFPTDQILLAAVLADREGCCLHSCGVSFEGKGLLFVGRSEAGKSTMARFFKGKAEILCDDRMIVRDSKDGFKIYGTWNHGDVPDISANPAALRAILFLEKAKDNRLIPLTDKKDGIRRILNCLIRPFVTAEWWDKTLVLIEKIADRVPCYVLEFDKSGGAVNMLRDL